jgi:hypothetical protein
VRQKQGEGGTAEQVEVRVGDVVTYSFRNYAKTYPPVGVTIERVRSDISWKDVILSYLKDAQKPQELNSMFFLLLSSLNPPWQPSFPHSTIYHCLPSLSLYLLSYILLLNFYIYFYFVFFVFVCFVSQQYQIG